MWENGNMRVHKDRKHVSFYALPEVKQALEDAVRHISRAAPEQTLEENGRYQNTHHLEALVCWLLTQPQETQDRIILEGRGIALRLRQLPTPAKDFPAAYGAGKPPTSPPKRGGGRLALSIEAGDSELPIEQRRGGLNFNPRRKK